MPKHTDLAMEARDIFQQEAGRTTKLPGVKAREWSGRGITATTVEILDEEGAQALCKPVGTYVTVQWEEPLLRDTDGFSHLAAFLGKQIRRMVPNHASTLVAGLGNAAVTPDALGPKCVEHLVVTRHLKVRFPQFRSVSAIAPGVLGTTGMESVEIIRGVVEKSGCECVVVVDALASLSPERVCNCVQLTDTGITPGSGVRNQRAAFDKQTLGVPVLAVGVPTVIDGAGVLQEFYNKKSENNMEMETKCYKNMVLTPRDVDSKICRLSRLLGYSLSLGLHRGLTLSEVSCLVG